jgi:hypothetical protein
MAETPSQRIIDQRVRNRTIDALEPLAGGNWGARTVGAVEYVEMFLDVVSEGPESWPRWQDNPTYTEGEVAALTKVHDLLVQACEATAPIRDDQQFVASGWPRRIQPDAAEALALMLRRGRFSEDQEEEEPAT